MSPAVTERAISDIDIGVIIPTRNSMPLLQSHLHALNQWIGRVREVVVVDSDSTDGTAEYIKSNLNHPSVTFLNHPPGLYESWNSAVRHIQSKYTYIATVGDYMPFETLERLYHCAESFTADVVLSAPDIITSEGELKAKTWPIHDFLKQIAPEESYSLGALERFVWNVSSLPGTLLGSSASNLYRTSILEQSPFPVDFGHAGDSAWAVARPATDRWHVVGGVQSRFLKHSGSGASRWGTKLSRPKLYRLAIDTFEEILNELGDEVGDLGRSSRIHELFHLFAEKDSAVEAFECLQSGRLPWYCRPRGWYYRSCKQRVNAQIKELSGLLRQQVLNESKCVRSCSVSEVE